jgi:hypothetical protein
MYILNDNQRSHLRYAISELSRCETKRHNLSDEQLMLIFRVLCYGAPVSYYENGNEAADAMQKYVTKPGEIWMGYNGAGWFTKDLF